jgi:predicted RND superfamily exporter protein
VVLLLAILAVVLRRPRLIVAGLLGNVLPLVLLVGLMALCRIPWSLGLLGLPVVVLGLAIDDTIHLLWPLRRTSLPPATGFTGAIRHGGTAVVATGLLLAACLAALARSQFQVNRELGFLLPAGLLLALLAELTLLPALLTSSRRR